MSFLFRNIAGFFPKKKKKFDLLFAIFDNKLQQAEISPLPLSNEDLQKVRTLLHSAFNDSNKIDAIKAVFAELDKAHALPSCLSIRIHFSITSFICLGNTKSPFFVRSHLRRYFTLPLASGHLFGFCCLEK
jgi:hypothetical protein